MLKKQQYDALGRIIAVWQRDTAGQLYCERAIRHDNAVLTGPKLQPAQIIMLTPTKPVSLAEAVAHFDANPASLVDIRKSVQRYCGAGQEIERRASREADPAGNPLVSLSGSKSLTVRGQVLASGWPRTANGFDWDGSAEPTAIEPLFRFKYDHRNLSLIHI